MCLNTLQHCLKSSLVECYWQCSDDAVHYKFDKRWIFAVLDVQLRRL